MKKFRRFSLFAICYLLFAAPPPLSASFIVTSGTFTILNPAIVEVTNDVIIESNGTLNAGSGLVNVGRRWENTGNFIGGTSTVTFYTTAVSTITGGTTFHSFRCETPGKQLSFLATSTQTVTNRFILTGALDNRLRLRSTTDGTRWFVAFSTTQTVNYVDVKDASALDFTITCFGSLNSGNNNENWIFGQSSPAVTNLVQQTSAGTNIPSGGWTNNPNIISSFTLTDADNDNIRYHLQVTTVATDGSADWSTIWHSTISAFLTPRTTSYQWPTLVANTTYWWRVWATDTVGLVSSTVTYLSGNPALPACLGFDNRPPSAISNLTALTGTLDGDVVLRWSAPSDDGAAEPLTNATYQIKAATFNITSALYDSVTNNPPWTHIVAISTTGVTPGSFQSTVIRGILYPGTTWFFAIKTIDKGENVSTWSTDGVNTVNSAPAQDLPPNAPPGITATPSGSTTIDVSWDLPSFSGTDDRDRYWLYSATFSFTSETTANVVHIATRSHPSASFTHTGLSGGTTYFYRVKTLDQGNIGNGLFSAVLFSGLSVITSTRPAAAAQLKVTVVYDDRSEFNQNNYGVVDGIEDADGTVAFSWPKVVGGGTIQNYFIEISSDINFSFFSSSATLPATVSTHTVGGLLRGVRHYARVRARNTDGDTSPWTASDGIYVNRKTIDSSLSDWTGTFPGTINTLTVSGGDALWRDAIGDQRTDRHTSSQLDISSVAVAADEYNFYLFVAFASTVSAGFDGRNFIQIMVDNAQTSTERVFRGLGNKYEDSYVASPVPWEWLCEIVSGNDVFRVEDSVFSNRRFGKYSEHNTNYFYEVAMPLSNLGGRERFLGRTVNFTIATFWNAGGADGSIGDWSAGTNSNIVDVVTSSGPNTWNEVQDRIVDDYLAVTFSTRGIVTSASRITAPPSSIPDEPEPPVDGIPPAIPWALDLFLYNIFIDAWHNGDPTNDDIADTNDYGGDFQGVIDKVDYLNEIGINMAYFGPPYQFGGGIWGFNIDDPYQYNRKFGGTSKYIEMMKVLRNHNIRVMNDWVCGQVGHSGSPAALKNPDFFTSEQFGHGTRQEFAEARAYYLNNMIWAFSTCDAFRYDNPKFWNYSFGPEAFEFNRALRKISDRWDPQLFIMGEIPEQVEGWDGINAFTGGKGDSTHVDGVGGFGAMMHGGQCMRSGGYKNNRNAHICSWVRPGIDAQTTPTARTGIQNQHVAWKNQWSINPIMMENHDEHRFISRGRDQVANAPWHQQVGYMTAFTVGVSPILFYGGEVGLEGPYDGGNSAKMDRGGNVRPMPFERVNDPTWSLVRNALRRTAQARMNFQVLRGNPKAGGRSWYTGGQYDNDVLVFVRQWGDGNAPLERAIVMLNRSASNVTLSSVGTGRANTKYKDWLTDEVFTTDASGNIGSIIVNAHYGRILIQGTVGNAAAPDPYDWGDVTGTVTNSAGAPIANAIVDIDGRSHWTTKTDSNGFYSINGDLKKVLTGSRRIRAWAPGRDIVTRSVTITTGNNNVSFSAASGFPLATDNTPPAAPTTLSARPRNKAAMLFWQANTESDIQTYLIYRSSNGPIPDGSNPVPIFEVFKPFYYDNNLDGKLDGNNNVYDRLQNGTTFWYRIRAVDRNGNRSALSNQIVVVPRKVKVKFWLDTRGSGLTVNSASIAGGALTFSKNYWEQVALNSNGDGTFERTFEFDDTTFLEYKYVINGTTWEGSSGNLFLDGPQGEGNRGELMDDGIPDVEIVDEGGGNMIIADVWRYYNDRPPRAPAGLQISAGPNVLTVGWAKNAEPDLLHYTIERSTWSSGFSGSTIFVNIDKNQISYDDTNLINNNTYYYRVWAIDRRNNISGWSSTVSAFPRAVDTTPPVAPSGLFAYGDGANGLSGVVVRWNRNFEGDLAGYNIHRSTESDFTPASGNKLNSVLLSPTTPSYTDANIVTGTRYFYRVTAVDDSTNVSEPSLQLAVRLLPITFHVDMGNINPNNNSVQITGNTLPLLGWTSGLEMSLLSGTTFHITIGLLAGTTIQYRYAYNNLSVREQDFATITKNREWTVPSSTTTKYDDWEENPEMVAGLRVYPGVNRAYLTWNKNTTAEDLAGYNIYRSVPPSTTPTLKVNSVPTSTQPYNVGGLVPNVTYYFSVRAVDSGSIVLESTAAAIVSIWVSSPVWVHFGSPFSVGQASAPWGDSNRIRLFLAIQTSTNVAVWSLPERADVTSGKMEMTASSANNTYSAIVPLMRGQYYNFLFFAETTGSPPAGLAPNTEYFDTVPGTGTFLVSGSSISITSPGAGVEGVFNPVGPNRDSRRLLFLPHSLTAGSTIYVFANFGSTPTAPTLIDAIPGNNRITLRWSAPYGSPWVNPSPELTANTPVGTGEAMKAADVVAGGVYQIFVTTYNHGSFASYIASATVSGQTFEHTFSGLTNGVTYYYLMRSSDTFRGLVGNNFSVLSATVSAAPTAAYIVTKFRVNRGAGSLWKSVRKTIAVQEGVSVAVWDADDRSNMTPTGRAVNMLAPPDDDATEQEFSVSLVPGTTYNFILFAYSTFTISGLITNATYFDTVPNSGSGGMVTSTSTISITGHGRAWCGPVGSGQDARRLLWVPTNLPSGATLYVYCNFASSPSASSVSAIPVSSFSVQLDWTPFGAWGTGGEALKAADVIAGGHYYVWRSSVSSSGPWVLWVSTNIRSWLDDDRNAPGDNLGMVTGVEYYYVVVSSDAYTGDFIPNMYRMGAPEFSSADASAIPRHEVPTYFRVDEKRKTIFELVWKRFFGL